MVILTIALTVAVAIIIITTTTTVKLYDYVRGSSVPRMLLTHLVSCILMMNLWGRNDPCPHFADKETETQRD